MSAPKISYVTDEAGLHAMARQLERASIIGLDTESNSLHVYREQVCFIQVIAQDEIFILDTLLVRDLAPLVETLESPDCIKVFHAADYDVSCLKRDFQIRPWPIFDTMVAAQILGQTQLGLAALVERYCGVTLDKDLARYDWGRRPLDERCKPYLENDVRYLLQIQAAQELELADLDREEEADIEFERVAGQDWTRDDQTDRFRRIKGAARLDQAGLSILKEAHAVRETVAESHDVPPFRVLGNEQLIQVALRRPRSLSELRRIRGFTDRTLKRLGSQMLQAVQEGLERRHEVPLRLPNKGERPSDSQAGVDEGLRVWRRELCERTGIPPLVVLPNHALERIARDQPTDLTKLEEVRGLGSKRARLYGEEILRIVRKPPAPKKARRR